MGNAALFELMLVNARASGFANQESLQADQAERQRRVVHKPCHASRAARASIWAFRSDSKPVAIGAVAIDGDSLHQHARINP